MMTLESSINTLASHDLTVALKRPVASDTEVATLFMVE